MDIVSLISRDPAISQLADGAAAGRRLTVQGSVGSSSVFVAAAIARRLSRTVIYVVGHTDEADEAFDELTSAGVDAVRLPALESMPGESNPSLDLFAERLAIAATIGDSASCPSVLICPIQALMQGVPSQGAVESMRLPLARGDQRGPDAVVAWLADAGYRRVDAIDESGEFAVRGGIVDVFPAALTTGTGSRRAAQSSSDTPVRLDFFGDELDRITEIDLETMASDRQIDEITLICADTERMSQEKDPPNFLDLVPPDSIACIHETLEVTEQGRGYYERVIDSTGIFGPPAIFQRLENRFSALLEIGQFAADAGLARDVFVPLPVSPLPPFSSDAAEAVRELGQMPGSVAEQVIVLCQNQAECTRFGELLREFGQTGSESGASNITAEVHYVHRGFTWGGTDSRQTAIVPYHELLHRFSTRRGTSKFRSARAVDAFLGFEIGDFVVHRDHGIAKFTGIKLMKPRAAPGAEPLRMPGERKSTRRRKKADEEQMEEYLTLEFASRALLHVPATKIDQVQKYIGGFQGQPKLSTLGGKRWDRQKQQVSESVRDLAGEMLRVRAARESMPGMRYPADTAWQTEFEAEFPFQETDDQLAALSEIKKDMQDAKPMDRLICGDVGYGKTELAIRAAFKAAEFGKQVAILVPTTVLAEQHERTFRSRFADYPFKVASLSRFKTGKEVTRVLESLRKGHIDIVIGTHRLVSKDVQFADLGLVVIDEEQRFGVEHKERLLKLRMTVDVMTLSATPIPRTLHMSMLGLRDISSLTTPPLDRRAVVTEVVPFNAERMKRAVQRELSRDGQVFVVHNRIHDIQTVADDIHRLVPSARIVVGHGQMPDKELERVMLKFMRREADVLVSTTIIESGIDIPTANTMLIRDADRFGLADLHQLRGRVGRYKHRAYCYLLLPEDRTVKERAVKRLKAIEEFNMLGAGFKIAMRDLEIRGAGNILGAEQSGHIAAVGYEMYCQLLDQAVKELKGMRTTVPSETAIEIGVTGMIPKRYIPSDIRRMEAYRRIAVADRPADLDRIERELLDAYGKATKPVLRLLDLARIRAGAAELHIRTLTLREQDIVMRVPPERAHDVARTFESARGNVTLLKPKKGDEMSEVYYRPPQGYLQPDTLVAVLKKRLAEPEAVAV